MISKVGLIILSYIFLTSCQEQNSESNSSVGKYLPEDALAYENEIEEEAPRTSEPPVPSKYLLEKGSKIIKNGSMKFAVTNLETAKVKVDSLLNKYSGFYENERYNSYGNHIFYSLLLRIPSAKFDSFVHTIEEGVGKLEAKNINAKDVTEEYVDLNIRLDNNLAYLNQYQEILKKAKSVKEILEVQEKIRMIEEEIESKKGRLNFLEDKVKYSTLSIEIAELIKSKLANKPNFGRRIVNAFNNGVKAFLNLIVGMVNIWPYLILIALLILAWRPVVNRIRRKGPPPNTR